MVKSGIGFTKIEKVESIKHPWSVERKTLTAYNPESIYDIVSEKRLEELPFPKSQ